MMDATLMNNIHAAVEFPIDIPLEDLAIQLEGVLGGLSFEREETGRFEEVPAFVAQQSGMTFILFGLPANELGDAFVLELSAETPLALQEFQKTVSEFVGGILSDKEINSRGYFDYSDELANALRSVGMEGCKAIS
ncbi:hypothetical protein [Paraherbaspirillum soli]|uniref:Uncharacterized protein n=1 Tax=Paraherbaspirillum soli TaxID=631222 RepID=A0ABW0M8B7_9BURK